MNINQTLMNEETSCSHIGFSGFEDDDELDSWEEEEELFEINCLKNEPLDTIKEEEEDDDDDDDDDEDRESVFSIDFERHNNNINDNNNKWKDAVCVCVSVDDDDESFGTLSWTLKHLITPSTTLCLLHVFPFSRLIPSPMGKLPRYHANRAYINYHIEQVKGKRKVLLQKFIDLCTASQVKVEATLIEDDNIAKAIVQHTKNHGITKLVIGTSKSNLSKTGHSRRNTIADEVVKNVPENCDVKIICQGKDVILQIIQNASSSPASSDSGTPTSSREEDESHAFLLFKKFFGPKISSPR